VREGGREGRKEGRKKRRTEGLKEEGQGHHFEVVVKLFVLVFRRDASVTNHRAVPILTLGHGWGAGGGGGGIEENNNRQ
jgi:hypothetical protein